MNGRFVLSILFLYGMIVFQSVSAQELTYPPEFRSDPVYLDQNGNVIPPPGTADGYTPQSVQSNALPTYPPAASVPQDPFSGTSGPLLGNAPATAGSALAPSEIADPTQGPLSGVGIPKNVASKRFQRFFFSGLWTPKNGDDGCGFTQLDLGTTLAFPFPVQESPLLITPEFSVWMFDCDRLVNDADTLYGAGCKFRWIKPCSPNLTLDAEVAPGYFSDFKAGSDLAFRIPGRLIGLWNYNPRTKIVLGCAYLDRSDFQWLPIGGIIWTPENLEMNFEILFPNPKISKRIRWFGNSAGKDASDWLYLAGEWGGGNWAVRGPNDTDLEIAYRDIRVLFGYEKKSIEGINFALEVGGLFDRKVRDSITDHDRDIDPGVFLRVKASY